MRKHPIYLLKKDRTYTAKELADALKVHVRTVQKWGREGLPSLPDTFPRLFKGEEVKAHFLSQKKASKKELAKDEFFCMHCHFPKHSVPAEIQIVLGRKMGRFVQYRVVGRCETCGGEISRLVSSKTPEVLEVMKQYQEKFKNNTGENAL